MLFYFYLKELKFRIFYLFLCVFLNFLVYFHFAQEVLFLVIKPLVIVNDNQNLNYFIFTHMSDVLFIYIKISLMISFFCSGPILFLQGWFFLVEGLYNYEKNFLFILFFGFLVLCVIVFLFLYHYIIPFIWVFFINFELNDSNALFGVYYEANITDYVNFIFSICLFSFILLLFPLIMVLSIYFNILNLKFFTLYRKYFYTCFLILSGIFSPPEILSQIIISVAIYIIYEMIVIINLVISYYFNQL